MMLLIVQTVTTTTCAWVKQSAGRRTLSGFTRKPYRSSFLRHVSVTVKVDEVVESEPIIRVEKYNNFPCRVHTYKNGQSHNRKIEELGQLRQRDRATLAQLRAVLTNKGNFYRFAIRS